MIALEIVGDIVEQGIAPGTALPQEAEMIARYGGSRSSFREAVRLLETQGLIKLRPGPGGGTVVGRSQYQFVSRTLRLHFHFIGATYNDLMSAYAQTEPLLAELAARNPDRELVLAAMAPFVEPGNRTDVRTFGDSFHEEVARISDNPILALTIRSMTAVMDDYIVEAVRQENFDDEIICEHREVAEAIIAGDPAAARRLMSKHMEHLVGHFNEFLPSAIGGKISLD